MRWAVEVEASGDGQLSGAMLAVVGMRLDSAGGATVLIGTRFEELDTAQEVRTLAAKVCDTVNQVASLRGYGVSLRLGSVVAESLDSAAPRRHHFLEVQNTVHLQFCSHATLITAGNVSPEDHQSAIAAEDERRRASMRSDATTHVRAAFNDKRVLIVLRLLDEEVSIQDMNHVLEIIRDDLGAELEGLVSRNALSLFKRSINHPSVFGLDARHAVSHEQPPPNAMSKTEAIVFIRRLASAWIARKGAD